MNKRKSETKEFTAKVSYIGEATDFRGELKGVVELSKITSVDTGAVVLNKHTFFIGKTLDMGLKVGDHVKFKARTKYKISHPSDVVVLEQ